MLGIVAIGVVRESRKFQGIHVQVAWGHCAVIFAIAQLSLLYYYFFNFVLPFMVK